MLFKDRIYCMYSVAEEIYRFEVGVSTTKVMFTLYRIAFAPARRPYQIGLLFTHKSGDFGVISVTERSCAARISKVESHISDRCSCYTG